MNISNATRMIRLMGKLCHKSRETVPLTAAKQVEFGSGRISDPKHCYKGTVSQDLSAEHFVLYPKSTVKNLVTLSLSLFTYIAECPQDGVEAGMLR